MLFSVYNTVYQGQAYMNTKLTGIWTFFWSSTGEFTDIIIVTK